MMSRGLRCAASVAIAITLRASAMERAADAPAPNAPAMECCVAADDSLLPSPRGANYAVVVSRATYDDKDWRPVVDALVGKYDAKAIVYGSDVNESLEPLRKQMPMYACFVARPEEAGRKFVVAVHRLTRKLDDQPYTDTLWGILTGYEAKDALRIARQTAPLEIRVGGAGTPIPMEPFESGKWFDEGRAGHYVEKAAGGKPEDQKGPQDSVAGIVDFVNEGKPQIFITSGHATEHDWRPGYSYKNGQLRSKDGVVTGITMDGKHLAIHSDNPKVYLGSGNCLIGHVADRQSMALAWMASGGVDQFVGYTVVTWYGAMGWGTQAYLFDLPGRYDLAEAFFFNNQTLVHTLETKYPKTARTEFTDFGENDVDKCVAKLDYKDFSKQAQEHVGLLWDRDTVAFYGDPAWQARLAPRTLPLTMKLRDDGKGTWHFVLTATADAKPAKPVAMLLPKHLKNIEVTAGKELEPLITHNFLMLTRSFVMKAGETREVTFKAEVAPRVETAKITFTPGAGPATAPTASAVDQLPEVYREVIARQLRRAGDHAAALNAAIAETPTDQRPALAFLLANMPEIDVKSLPKELLLENVAYACKARTEAAWAASIPDDVFLNAVLPYASVNEQRESWRKDFYDRFHPWVADCKTPGEAALVLNKRLFKELNVRYHPTERPKPDQSPSESIACGYASCTGLSILLIDACRAVGVPARFVGTPEWTTGKGDANGNHAGNHSWVEVWDGSQWRVLGASEVSALDKTWFMANASKADPTREVHRIYATSFKRTATRFPLVWDETIDWVSAEDVTQSYLSRTSVRVKGEAGTRMRITSGDRLIADVAADENGREVALSAGQSYTATLARGTEQRERTFVVPRENKADVVLSWE
jgi:hypothetical protein